MSGAPEEWRAVPGIEGYEASTRGRIRSVDRAYTDSLGRPRKVTGRVLTLNVNGRGYRNANFGRQGQHAAHRIIALTFLGEPPSPDMQVCHGNGDKADNRVENLRWGTPSENSQDAIRHGVHPSASRTHCPQGHPYQIDNIYWDNGGRKCRICVRARVAARKRRLLEAEAS